MIINTTEATADDLHWYFPKADIPKEQYTKINDSALNVTVHISSETPVWLFCKCKKESDYVYLNSGRFFHGIVLTKGCKF